MCNTGEFNFFTGRTKGIPENLCHRLGILGESYHGRLGLIILSHQKIFLSNRFFSLLGSNRKDLSTECVGLRTGCKLYDPNYIVCFLSPCINMLCFQEYRTWSCNTTCISTRIISPIVIFAILHRIIILKFAFLFKNRIENNLPSYKVTTGPKIMKLSQT